MQKRSVEKYLQLIVFEILVAPGRREKKKGENSSAFEKTLTSRFFTSMRVVVREATFMCPGRSWGDINS